MRKIKHARTADCVVAGFRWHKNGAGTHVGSLILGLFDLTHPRHAGGLFSPRHLFDETIGNELKCPSFVVTSQPITGV